MTERDKDNSFIKQELIGKEFNEKLNDLMYDHFARRKFQSLGFQPRPGLIALVHTLEDGMLKEVGASAPGDIVTDNFGKWLAAMNSPIMGGFNNPLGLINSGGDPRDTGGVLRPNVYFYNTGSNNYNNGGAGGRSYIQIGAGVTAPDVTDFAMETPFIGGPEANQTLVIGSGAYNPSTGVVAIGTNIGPVTQIGAITELGWIMEWAGGGFFLCSHDAINPAVGFIVGETVFAQYFFQL